MTKEEIQAQIDIIEEYDLEDFCEGLVETLTDRMESVKSITDLIRNAFNAGRSQSLEDIHLPDKWIYATFDDYIKSKKRRTLSDNDV